MHWQFTPFAITLIVAANVSFLLSLTLLKRRRETYVTLLALALLAEGEWTFFAGLEAASVDLSARILFSKIEYLGIYNCVPLFLLFGVYYVGLGQHLPIRKALALWIIPVIILSLVATNDYHRLWWSNYYLDPNPAKYVYIFERGPLYWLGALYIYTSLLAITILLVRHALFSRFSIYRTQSLIVLSGIPLPWLANLVYLLQIEPLRGLDFTPIAFTFTGCCSS